MNTPLGMCERVRAPHPHTTACDNWRQLPPELERLSWWHVAIMAFFIVWSLLMLGGCAALRAAVHEDESAWSPEMRAERRQCETEVVAGRWGWGHADPFDRDHWPRSYATALRLCLRSDGWHIAGAR